MIGDMKWMLTSLTEDGHNFKGADSVGHWEPMSGTLGELGQAVSGKEQEAVDVVRSTPDPWAQVRSFADAVLSPSSRRGEIVDQWRGLLALFALAAEYRNIYTLQHISVPLAASNSLFSQVMRHLLPRTSLPPSDNRDAPGWDCPVIVTLVPTVSGAGSRHNVGMLNPACLVAAGRDAEKLRFDPVPWMRNGLTDPTKLTGQNVLSPGDLQILLRYLKRLTSQLQSACADKGSASQRATLEQLSKRLVAYRDDCLKKLGGVDDEKIKTHDGDSPSAGLHSLYQLCITPIVAEVREGSECIVRLRNDLGESPFKGLVLLDRSLETKDRGAATDILFWGRTNLEQALSAPPSQIEAWRTEIANAGYLLVTPDELFTSVLVRMDEKSEPASIDAHPAGLKNCLLPLSPLALLIYRPNELKENIAISGDGLVSLQLTVGSTKHKLARRYVSTPSHAGEGLLLDETDWVYGDFAIWPNFSSSAWHHYCARIDYATSSFRSVRGRFAMSGPIMADLLREGPLASRAVQADLWASSATLGKPDDLRLDPVAQFADRKYKGNVLTRLRASNSAGKASEVQISTKPFEAACFSIVPDSGDARPAGLCLLTTTHIAEVHERKGIVAIDFGTTNTVACLNNTTPLLLKTKVVHPIHRVETHKSREGELAQKFRDFLPPDNRLLPTPTVVINRLFDGDARSVVRADKPLARHAFIRQTMYFQPDFAENGAISSIPLHEWSNLLLNLKYNLKWSKEQDIREAARAYLQQLMLMIACEWASDGFDPMDLSWHYSRPLDMGDDPDFVAILQEIAQTIFPGVGAEVIRKTQNEGDAAAVYIMDEQSNPNRTKGTINIILDIGGGTTDISIRNNDHQPQILASASLRLAGGDFFTDHIIQNPEILADFGLSDWADIIASMHNEQDNSLKENIHYIGELLFSGRTLDNAISREWPLVSGKDTVKRLKETSFLFLGGVAWLVGRHLRNLISEGRVPLEALDDIAVALCGRGSGLFVRLHGNDPLAVTPISKLFRLIAAAAGQAKARIPQVQVSPTPKIEVAAGMFLAARSQSASGIGSAATLAIDDIDDLVIELDDGQTMASNRLEDGPNTTMALDVGVGDLDLFLKVFGQVSGFNIVISDLQRKKIINGVVDIKARDAADGRREQSEFAAALKMLVGFLRLRPEEAMRPKTIWGSQPK